MIRGQEGSIVATGDTDLRRVRNAISELIREKRLTNPRAWSDDEAIRYRNLCELEEALMAIERLDAAAS